MKLKYIEIQSELSFWSVEDHEAREIGELQQDGSSFSFLDHAGNSYNVGSSREEAEDFVQRHYNELAAIANAKKRIEKNQRIIENNDREWSFDIGKPTEIQSAIKRNSNRPNGWNYWEIRSKDRLILGEIHDLTDKENSAIRYEFYGCDGSEAKFDDDMEKVKNHIQRHYKQLRQYAERMKVLKQAKNSRKEIRTEKGR